MPRFFAIASAEVTTPRATRYHRGRHGFRVRERERRRARQQHLLLAIIGLHPNAYGVSIQDHIKERTGREPSTGSIYASLDRLEEKGFVKTRQGEPTKERGGKRKLYFTITGPGQHTLRQSLQAIRSLCEPPLKRLSRVIPKTNSAAWSSL